jgi:hypothetical protein
MSKINFPIPNLKPKENNALNFNELEVGKTFWIVPIGELPDSTSIYHVDYPKPFQATIKSIQYSGNQLRNNGFIEGVVATFGNEQGFFFPEDLFDSEEKANKFINKDRKKQINKRIDQLYQSIPVKQKELSKLNKELEHLTELSNQLTITDINETTHGRKAYPNDLLKTIRC